MKPRISKKPELAALPGTMLLAVLFLSMSTAAATAQEIATNDRCMACHSAPGLSKQLEDGQTTSLHVSQQEFAESAHGKQQCVDCHTDMLVQAFPHKTPAAAVQCGRCHSTGSSAKYMDSVHGRAAKNNDPDAPGCKDCHGTHGILPASNPKSSVSRAMIAETCAGCHGDPDFVKKRGAASKFSYRRYKESVHGRGENGSSLAVCSDCHGAHTIKAVADPMSTINKQHIPETCGKCHEDILVEYTEGVHGQALAKGMKDAPVCTNCHGEHGIMRRTEEASMVYPTHVVTTCSQCHEDVQLQRQYGLAARRLGAYIDSYHGIANKFGDTTVANCSTCHMAHAIYRSSDARAATHKDNIPETCGKCHPGAGANFAKGNIHLMPSRDTDAVIYWVKLVYMAFIVAMISSFAGYIGLDLLARYRDRERRME